MSLIGTLISTLVEGDLNLLAVWISPSDEERAISLEITDGRIPKEMQVDTKGVRSRMVM
jgi:hypothetical protein